MTRVTWMSIGQDDLVWDDLENEIVLWNFFFFSYHFCSQLYKNNQKALTHGHGDSPLWPSFGATIQKKKNIYIYLVYRLKSHKRSYQPRLSLSYSLVGLQVYCNSRTRVVGQNDPFIYKKIRKKWVLHPLAVENWPKILPSSVFLRPKLIRLIKIKLKDNTF